MHRKVPMYLLKQLVRSQTTAPGVASRRHIASIELCLQDCSCVKVGTVHMRLSPLSIAHMRRIIIHADVPIHTADNLHSAFSTVILPLSQSSCQKSRDQTIRVFDMTGLQAFTLLRSQSLTFASYRTQLRVRLRTLRGEICVVRGMFLSRTRLTIWTSGGVSACLALSSAALGMCESSMTDNQAKLLQTTMSPNHDL